MTSSRSYGAGAASSVIDAGSYFNGTYRSPGDLRIEGEFEGEIQCTGRVNIAESARVSGTITAGNVSVSGQVQGQVNCEGRFEILASGQVSARVLTGSVIVREGAFYEGDMRMRNAPDGLPARELTREASEAQAPQLTPVPPSSNGHDESEASSLHALPE